MIQLTKREEEVMLILWKSSNLTVNEILSYTKEANRRHYNTVSTILKVLEDKKVIGHFDQGGVFRYFPNVFFYEYRKFIVDKIVDTYFNGSSYALISMAIEIKKASHL